MYYYAMNSKLLKEHHSSDRESYCGCMQADSRQQTADSRQQTADSRQQTADSRQQTADGLWT
jgi:hypothetical protein